MKPSLLSLTERVTYARIGLELIELDAQVRSEYSPETLRSLGRSMAQDGQFEPCVVYHDAVRLKHVIVVGHRRFLAARLVGLPTLHCIVFPDEPSPGDIARAQILENSLRENLNPIDEARAYRTLMEREGLNQAQLAEALQVAPSSVTRALALLDLPGEFQERLKVKGPFKPGHARELARLTDEGSRGELLARIEETRMTAAQAAKEVARLLKPPRKAGRPRSSDRRTYKGLAGYEASYSWKRIVLVPSASGKPRTPEQVLSALELLVQRIREDIARGAAKGQEASPVAAPGPQVAEA